MDFLVLDLMTDIYQICQGIIQPPAILTEVQILYPTPKSKRHCSSME